MDGISSNHPDLNRVEAQEQVTPPPRAISGRNLGDKEPQASEFSALGVWV